ncbi:unnamed protein product, partial [Iphiclides podalirius]
MATLAQASGQRRPHRANTPNGMADGRTGPAVARVGRDRPGTVRGAQTRRRRPPPPSLSPLGPPARLPPPGALHPRRRRLASATRDLHCV